MFGISSLLTLALATFTIASPALVDRRTFEVKNGVNYTVFEHVATGSKLSFVTNSGVCETTPGVNQYSGYFSVGTNMVNYTSPCVICVSTDMFSEYVVLVLRSPQQPLYRTSRFMAQWGSWLQQHDWPLPGEWPLHLQQCLWNDSRAEPQQLE